MRPLTGHRPEDLPNLFLDGRLRIGIKSRSPRLRHKQGLGLVL
jgi:hypothetical protein